MAPAGSSSASDRSRARRCWGVIERLAKTAASAGSCSSRNGNLMFQGSRGNHPGQAWVPHDTPGRRSEAQGQHEALAAVSTVHSASMKAKPSAARREHEERGDVIEIAVTHSAFCRFVEGKRFDCKVSIEGFLRTLSGTGRLLAAHGGAPATAEEQGALQGQARFYATTARHRMTSSAEEGSPPPGTVGTARWGARGQRRASSQFTRGLLSTPAAAARGGGSGAGGSSARSIGVVAGYPSSRSGASATPRSSTNSGGFLSTTRGGIRARGFVAEALLSFDADESGTMSSAEFVSAANRVTGLPVREEWGEVLARRFAAGVHGVENSKGASRAGSVWGSGGGGGVRWLGGGKEGDKNSTRLDVIALVGFLRPKSFSLSVMTPFGLVDLLLEDSYLTLGDLREITVNKMFWRQHNCQVRRSDRDNFTLSRHYGTLPLDTESPGQRRRLVLDVLRPGELIFVTDRAPRRSRQEEPRSVPKFQYMMGAPKQHAAEGHASESFTCRVTGSAERRNSSPAAGSSSANATSNARKPGRRSSAPPSPSPSPRRQLMGATTFAAAAAPSATRTSAGGGSGFSPPSERRLKGAASSRGVSQPADQRRRSTLKADSVEAVPSGEGGFLSAGAAGGREHGRAGSREGVSTPASTPPKEGRTTPDVSTIVFDWSADHVEQWIGETLELGCCREFFRANKIDGLHLCKLSQDHLMKEVGIKNGFHARKVDLHLDRLLAGALGPHSHVQISRGRVSTASCSWRWSRATGNTWRPRALIRRVPRRWRAYGKPVWSCRLCVHAAPGQRRKPYCGEGTGRSHSSCGARRVREQLLLERQSSVLPGLSTTGATTLAAFRCLVTACLLRIVPPVLEQTPLTEWSRLCPPAVVSDQRSTLRAEVLPPSNVQQPARVPTSGHGKIRPLLFGNDRRDLRELE